MTEQQNPHAPVTRRNTADIVKKDFHKRLSGKPTRSSSLYSIPRSFGNAAKRVLQVVLIVVLIVAFTGAGVGGGMLVGYITTAKAVSTGGFKNMNQPTIILDDKGVEVARLTGESNINSEFVSFSLLKDTFIDEAFIAIEDERFYDHQGIDPKRIGSAIFSALSNGGSATHGGSTITQQTVRLYSGEDKRSAQRKIQEWYAAVELEKDKSKEEIMEIYLNLVPMGNSFVGIQSAAKAYFGKEAKDLSIAECAFLAGIPNRPSTYNPLTEAGKRNALRRMRIVLGKMHDLGKINDEQYHTALNTELIFKSVTTTAGTAINSYFVEYAIDQVVSDLQTKLGYSKEMARLAVNNFGMTIETTEDLNVQTIMEGTFSTQSLFVYNLSRLSDYPEEPTGSMVVISSVNPGQIKGMVGGYGQKTQNAVWNRAARTQRQPGSSIKPFAVYGPGIDTGVINAASIFNDQKLYYNPEEPTTVYPNNADDNSFDGLMPVRRALSSSKNTIAAQIWKEVLGGDTSLEYLRRAGLDRPTENYVSIALGGFSVGMTTLEMASAYGTFANSGVYTKPYAYTRVLDAQGNVLLENKPISNIVFKPAANYVMISMMRDVVTRGTAAHVLNGLLPGIDLAGKTGTTDENRDKWFCGYTPYYSASVWYGYDNRYGVIEIPQGTARNGALRIWGDAMKKIHAGLPGKTFAMPSGVISIAVCAQSGQLQSANCPAGDIYSELFVNGASSNPSVLCPFHSNPTPTETLPTTGDTTIPSETTAPPTETTAPPTEPIVP